MVLAYIHALWNLITKKQYLNINYSMNYYPHIHSNVLNFAHYQEDKSESHKKARTTFYDVIDMIRAKKLLNKKTTATLPGPEPADKSSESAGDGDVAGLGTLSPQRLKKLDSSSMYDKKIKAGPGSETGKNPKSESPEPFKARKALR